MIPTQIQLTPIIVVLSSSPINGGWWGRRSAPGREDLAGTSLRRNPTGSSPCEDEEEVMRFTYFS